MVKILRNCDPMDDCKPVVFMSCFLLIFWLLLSYITNSYFAIFLMVSNFILIFGCCVSLSGYVVGQLIDTRRETGQLIEVTTISASQPFVRPPEYPPSYDEAIRYGWQHCRPQNGGGDGVVLRIPLENDPRINPIYMNLPYSAPVENSHLPITYNGMQNIPSYEMSTSSAVTSSPLTLNMISRSTTMSDLENSTTIMERYSNIPSYEMSTSPAVASSPLTLNMASRSTTVGDLENSTAIMQLYPTIPSYRMSTLSASVSSPMTLTGESRSTTVSDLENSTSVMESYSAIQTLTPLTESTTTNSNLENSIILDAYPTPQTLTLFSRSTSVSEIASNLENSSTSPDIMESHPNQISRFCVSESTDLCSKREINIGQKRSCVSKSEAQFEHERHWSMCSEHSSQDLEFQRFSSSLSLRHPISLNRSLSFPDIK